MCISAVALGAGFAAAMFGIFYHSDYYIEWENYFILDLAGKIISLPTLVSCSVGDY